MSDSSKSKAAFDQHAPPHSSIFNGYGLIRMLVTNNKPQMFVTWLALIGWVGLAAPIIESHLFFYRTGFAPYLGGSINIVFAWFGVGVILIVVDAIRAKQSIELLIWVLAAVPVALGIIWLMFDRLYPAAVPHVPGSTPLLPAVLIAFIVAPTYTLFLTYLAARSWVRAGMNLWRTGERRQVALTLVISIPLVAALVGVLVLAIGIYTAWLPL